MHNALSLVNSNNAECIHGMVQNARMDKDDEMKRQAARLRAAREALFGSVGEGYERVKEFSTVSITTYTQHENGTRGYKARAAEYAKAFGVSASWLLWGGENKGRKVEDSAQKAREIPVVGNVQAGAFMYVQDFDHYDDDTEYVPFLDPKYARAPVYALRVVGDSCNLKYPDRATLYYVPIPDISPRENQFVVVRCYDETGKAETTVKQIERSGSIIRLMPRSTNPKHKPIEYDIAKLRDESVQDGPQVIGVVIGSYIPDDSEAGGYVF